MTRPRPRSLHEQVKLLEDRTLLCVGTPSGCEADSTTFTSHWTSDNDKGTCVRCGAKMRWSVKRDDE